MKKVDLAYVCRAIGNLSGIPIRLYRRGKQVFFFSMVNLVKDPVNLYLDAINAISDNIGYYVTPHFDYYGVVKYGDQSIVIGPTRQLKHSAQEMKELAFLCDVPQDDFAAFSSALNNIINMPLDGLMQMLCVINYVLNGEKKQVSDISVFDENMQKEIRTEEAKALTESGLSEDSVDVHNTLALEQTLMNFVRKGDLDALNKFIEQPVVVNSGKIASDQIRQHKNIFIVSCTLVSRAAIRGGMDVNDSLSLSDFYIKNCELLNNLPQIAALQLKMVVDFTTKVNKIRNGNKTTKLVIDVKNYILHHLSEQITATAIANALYISRGYLCEKFKKESGTTLSDFILSSKTEEAKQLLTLTDKSISAISEYLGFSSQSHFNNTFKKYTGVTPNRYRALRSS